MDGICLYFDFRNFCSLRTRQFRNEKIQKIEENNKSLLVYVKEMKEKEEILKKEKDEMRREKDEMRKEKDKLNH